MKQANVDLQAETEVAANSEQLHPERARSCRNAVTMASVMVDEIRLRAPPARSTSREQPTQLFG